MVTELPIVILTRPLALLLEKEEKKRFGPWLYQLKDNITRRILAPSIVGYFYGYLFGL